MKTKLTPIYLLISALLVPIATYADDADQDRSSPKAFVKDSVITTKIKAELVEEKLSSAAHIKVDTDSKGIVQLSGTAKNQAEVDKAGTIASGVEGVASVENNIHIAKAPAEKHETKRVASDSWITTKVKSAILADSVSKSFKVSVKTFHGVVALKGTLANQDAIDHVKDIAEKVEGVKSVNTSGLTVAA